MKIILCNEEYAEPILEILNEAILNSTAIYDYKERSIESMKSWFDFKNKNSFPVIGLIDEQNNLLGFGTYGGFRSWPAYKYSVEHSLYIHTAHRGKGLGKILLAEIIQKAISQNYHCLIAGIDSTNIISINLHKSFKFEYCGQINEVGYKFSKWLDLEFYQLLLNTPTQPDENV